MKPLYAKAFFFAGISMLAISVGAAIFSPRPRKLYEYRQICIDHKMRPIVDYNSFSNRVVVCKDDDGNLWKTGDLP